MNEWYFYKNKAFYDLKNNFNACRVVFEARLKDISEVSAVIACIPYGNVRFQSDSKSCIEYHTHRIHVVMF